MAKISGIVLDLLELAVKEKFNGEFDLKTTAVAAVPLLLVERRLPSQAIKTDASISSSSAGVHTEKPDLTTIRQERPISHESLTLRSL